MADPPEAPFPRGPAGRSGWPWASGDIDHPLEPPLPDPGMPRVSVITPSFNQGLYLEEAIRSVLLQNHPNLEYIVIDGGSTDASPEIIRRYDPWIAHWVSEPDDGQADAINRGFDRATGEYLCWLNADDVLYQGFLAKRVEEFGGLPETDLIYGDVHSGWDDGERSDFRGKALSYLDMLRTLNVAIPQQSAVWRKRVVDRLGGLDPRWRVVLDREFFLRIARQGPIEYIPGSVGFFRQHGTAKSVAETAAWVDELPRLYTEFFAAKDLSPEEAKLERETMAAMHLMCAEILRSSNRWGGFLAHFARAVRSSPHRAIVRYGAAKLQGLRGRISRAVSTGLDSKPDP